MVGKHGDILRPFGYVERQTVSGTPFVDQVAHHAAHVGGGQRLSFGRRRGNGLLRFGPQMIEKIFHAVEATEHRQPLESALCIRSQTPDRSELMVLR